MTDAPKSGLRLAAPKLSGKSIADLSAEDLLAGISAETRVTLAAALAAEPAPPAPKADDAKAGEDEEMPKKAKKKDDVNDDADAQAADPALAAARAEGFEAGQKAEAERVAAVFASEHFAGREQQAAKMLANPKLSADDITGLLADMPDGSGASMLAAIKGKNPNLNAGGGSEQEKSQSAQSIWDSAIKANNPVNPNSAK